MNSTLQPRLANDQPEMFDDQIARSATLLAESLRIVAIPVTTVSDPAHTTPLPRVDIPRSRPRRSRWPANLLALLIFLSSLVAIAICRSHDKPTWRPTVRPIETFRVGQAARSENPTGEEDLSLGDHVDRETWRHLILKAPKFDGSWADVELIRPLWWLKERNAQVGEFIDIDVPHCGIEGEAEVLAINVCPPVEPTPKGYRTVTGTFRHHNAEVIDLYIEGLDKPIGTTPNHLFWSEDQGAFVRAESLSDGETLKHGDGTVTHLRTRQARLSTETVYNLEVQGSHAYCVSTNGIVVHNAREAECPKPVTRRPRRTYVTYTADDLDPKNLGKTYVGRTSGPIGMSPQEILDRRAAGHHRDLGPLQQDQVTESYNAARGREQQLRDNAVEAGTGTDQINPISPTNPRRKKYLDAARKSFGGIEE